jgi:hypothetical protein
MINRNNRLNLAILPIILVDLRLTSRPYHGLYRDLRADDVSEADVAYVV